MTTPTPLTPEQALLQVTQLLTQLTTRVTADPVPEPVVFSLGSGRPLSEFLAEFETYAKQKYGHDQRLWTPRLAKYLKPPVLTHFQHLTQVSQDYSVVKDALISSYETAATSSPADQMEKFNTIKYDPSEGIRGLVSRLKVLATRVYAGVPSDTTDELIKRRCISALPPHLEETLNFWVLANPNATLQDFMRVGSGLEESSAKKEVAIASLPTPESPAVRPKPVPVKRNAVPAVTRTGAPQVPMASDNEPKFCRYCKRRGHLITECYLRNGQCFRCGQPGHFADKCSNAVRPKTTQPEYRQNSTNPFHTRVTEPERPSPTDNLSTCMFCNGIGHAMARCPEFDDYMDRKINRHLNR